MPYSSPEGKPWVCERICALHPASVLDIGAGAGTYATLLRPQLPGCTFTAIEVYAPYVDRFGLRDLYSALVIGDVRFFNNLPLADVIILGDVLEHLQFDEALDLWDRARAAAHKAVFLSLPIVDYPQGECEGNDHEAHLHTWSHDLVMTSLRGIVDHATYREIGVYQAEPA